MSQTHQFIRGCILIVVMLLAAGAIFWRSLKKSRDPSAQLFRSALTGVIVFGAFVNLALEYAKNGRPTIYMLLFGAVTGVVLAIIWAPVLTDYVGGLFGNIFSGGNREVDPKPFYSIFRAKRNKGQYLEALAEVRRQLERFPKDFDGQMLLADLQAVNLNDLPGAELTIQRACEQSERTPREIAYALNQLADWHLGLMKDRDAAQRTLEKIIELLPDIDLALVAEQRISRLADNEMVLASADREALPVKKGVHNLGLHRGADGRLKAPEVDPEKLAAEYVARLEQHPLDNHVREQLAVIYAKHYRRLDLAEEQLEQLIQQPAQPSKQIARWLNLKTDLQVAGGASLETAQATLRRIVALFPDIAAAEIAQRRISQLKLELKAQDKTSAVALGAYDQNIGLKRRG
jgi:tetratricopeptide (TPR) repeat protein